MDTIKVYEYDTREAGNLRTACALLNAFNDSLRFHVGVTYFDYGQDWKWTTLICEKAEGDRWGGFQINPSNQYEIVTAQSMTELAKACESLLSDCLKVYHR